MDGMILCDKPEGASSHDEVLRVRRALRGAKTGHAGTLDPFATGLLIVLVGRATRIARYILTLPKTYVTVARYGAAIKNAREARKSERVLNSLPLEIQKDIGWPVTPRQKRLSSNSWGRIL